MEQPSSDTEIAAGSLLEEALEAWEDARRGLIAEARNVPSDAYDFRPTDEVRDVAELLVHVMEVSAMMVGELTRSDGSFARAAFPALIEEHASHLEGLREKEEVLEVLDTTLREGLERFRAAGELHMLGLIERFDGRRGTRLAWLHHGIAQEMYHRGQLCTYERLLGRVPALTKRIRGEE